MIAPATPATAYELPHRRFTVTPAIELAMLALAVGIAVASYVLIVAQHLPQRLMPPLLIASLLIANLLSGVGLMMLAGRRIARRRAARSPLGGGGQLHVRLVALFSVMAAVPMLLVTIFASLLFQYGVQFWYSDRASGLFENATALANSAYAQMLDRWDRETVTMASDLATELRGSNIDGAQFSYIFGRQTFLRSLNEAAIYSVTDRAGIQTIALVNPYQRDLSQLLTPQIVASLRAGQESVVKDTGERIETLTPIPGYSNLFLYGGRINDSKVMSQQTARARAVLSDYRLLISQARSLQLKFNAALLIMSLLIVALAVWIALTVADRLVRPVGELVGAAQRVEGGDLSARVAAPVARDEVGILSGAFNRMTERLQQQNQALLNANDQLDSRRALIEAVMAGVSAGVIATGDDRTVRIANSSADRLLSAGPAGLVGRKLAYISPELDAMLDRGEREGVVQLGEGGEPRTLAVRVARTDTGPILTFDDITQQLLDQRRAAWSDVARRIAHEIKNPLTPIQLAAERLNRRYGGKIDADDPTFGRLTDTIIRQVGDLRRMVDEFSSFARMPKPSFDREPLVDSARQAMFLHEVAHPGIDFTLIHDDPGPILVCDRRQIGQALTNIVKNAVEAIEAKGIGDGAVTMTLTEDPGATVTVMVEDNGIGLPADRDRIVEPYVTTRTRGTGLGLAIVNKIIEEHSGIMTFLDRPGGGTVVTMTFDTRALAALDRGDLSETAGEGRLATSTQIRT